MKIVLLFAALLSLSSSANAQLAVAAGRFHNCGLEGSAKPARVKALNRLKNRATEPTVINTAITLADFYEPGDDSKRFSNDDGVRIVGYVSKVKPGGLESVGCGTADLRYRDTHIEITRGPQDTSKPMVAEVTPRFREAMLSIGVDWSTAALKKTLVGHFVEFTGWLMLDAEHLNAAENTHPKGKHNWRTSAWEIGHPVTAIRVVPAEAR